MKKAYFWPLIAVYSLALMTATSLAWKVRTREPARGSMCFDSYSCLSPEYMAKNGVLHVILNRENAEAMHKDIREYFAARYRKELPETYAANLAAASTAERKKKYTAILESLKKGIDVDPVFSEPRAYRGLEGIVAMVASVSAYIPDEGNVGYTGGVAFFRHEGTSYKFVRTEPLGEDVNIFESTSVEMFKRDEAGAR